MKKLTSKKGFTLVEMLVVIAIIAVLVAIIIPTVTSATTKAKAATDAANLRSAKAELTIQVLDGTIPAATTDGTDISTYLGTDKPTSKTNSGDTFTATLDKDGTIKVAFGSNDIEHYATIADKGNSATSE